MHEELQDRRIHDWLDTCCRASRSPTHQRHDFRNDTQSECAPFYSHPPLSESYTMSNYAYALDAERDVQTRRHQRKAPSRKQPDRAASSRSQPDTSGRQCAPGVDVFDQPRVPLLLPPASDTQFGSLTAITANLNISTSSLSLSDVVSSTQLTSASRHHRSKENANRTKDSDFYELSIGKRTRSRSPVKKIVDLSAARPPIRYNPSEVPQDVGSILKRFKKVFKGRHLMPLCLKVSCTHFRWTWHVGMNQFSDRTLFSTG